MKILKRDVYIKEFCVMNWVDRYIYSVVNFYARIDPGTLEFNPLKWSVLKVLGMALLILMLIVIPFASIHHAFFLKRMKMPKSKDPMFKGDDWKIKDQWVVDRK